MNIAAIQKRHFDAEATKHTSETTLRCKAVVLSPHLDDAILSLGCTISRSVRLGGECSIVTIFAGDPDSVAPAGSYDRKCGFLSAGEAAAVRRKEDKKACSILGAKPVWLPFSNKQYDPFRDGDDVWASLEPHVETAEILLLPGFPLTHRDHAWVTELVLDRAPKGTPIGFYVEQPYAGSAIPIEVGHFVAERPLQWVRVHAGIAERFNKGRACRAYWSQFRTWGCHLPRRFLLPEVFWIDEHLGGWEPVS
jgi:LmbE family N-acetylglucosaminyl deacetylase